MHGKKGEVEEKNGVVDGDESERGDMTKPSMVFLSSTTLQNLKFLSSLTLALVNVGFCNLGITEFESISLFPPLSLLF